ncbi:MAG: DUF433 domain-containing protein [Phycisphaerae bacterium]
MTRHSAAGARIAGHRIRVLDIVAWTECQGYSPDEIVLLIYPELTLAQVHAALSYYFDHRGEIQAEFASDADVIRRVRAANPSKLHKRAYHCFVGSPVNSSCRRNSSAVATGRLHA